MTETCCTWVVTCGAPVVGEVARCPAPGHDDERRAVCRRHLEIAQALGFRLAEAGSATGAGIGTRADADLTIGDGPGDGGGSEVGEVGKVGEAGR